MKIVHSTYHATFVIERTYAAPVARVFQSWADPAQKTRWFVGPDEWVKQKHELDFRIGGRETVAGGQKEGPVHAYDARYHDIVPNERIVLTYDMYVDEQRISVSLATVTFTPKGTGTRLLYTEQGVFLDGTDSSKSREIGTRDLLDNLERELTTETPS